jgi:hypothetical protein
MNLAAKHKANELFDKMDMIIYTDQDNWKQQCKQCAIIAVDLAIEYNDFHIEFLQEVKEEILKL